MSVVDKFLKFMNVNHDEADEDDYDYDEDYEDVPSPKKSIGKKEDADTDIEEAPKKPVSKITPVKPVARRVTSGNGMELCVIRPKTFEEATEITDTLLANRAVVLNLEGVDVDIAQRIIDFSSGSCYAINGNLQKISRYIFIITPPSVDISGDFQGLLGSTFDSPLNAGI